MLSQSGPPLALHIRFYTTTELHDSRGIVALLRQHPQEEGSLLIRLGGGGDDDVASRWERATKNNLPPCDILGAVEDWAEHAQVLTGQVRILRMGLERQHTLIYPQLLLQVQFRL